MKGSVTRREFLMRAAAAGAGLTAGASAAVSGDAAFVAASAAATAPMAGQTPGAFKTTLRKALIMGKIDPKTCDAWKAAGFDGIECSAWSAAPKDAEEGRKIAEKAGLKIHCVLRGWVSFNQPGSVEKDSASVETALKAAAAYGADAVLLVPCRTGGTMPKPWDYDYEFDEKTCRISRVVKGDNAPYADYIKAQNVATDASRSAVEKLIPAAEKAGVVIALENVWNSLWVKPDFFAAFVRSFGSKWVQAYFDIGNHVKYAPPEEWIAALGKLLAKAHVKDFRLNPDGRDGRFVNIRDGSVNWPSVRKELDKAGYNGWMTIEGSDGPDGLSLEERSKRLDLIIAGR